MLYYSFSIICLVLIQQDEMESNMITALYLIMIAMCVAKGRSSSSQANAVENGGVGGNNGLGALNGGIGVVGFGIRGVEGGDTVRQSLQQLHQVVEKESQVHHTVYRYVYEGK